MRILTFTTLFPNAAKPHHGIFTETTLRHQLATGEVMAKVVAPIPWFPSGHRIFGEYGVLRRAPDVEVRVGVEVYHPRYAVVPKIGMYATPFSLACSARRTIGRLLDEGHDFDVIDAHYFYPDGVAAALLGKYFNKPLVISALGTDINLIMRFPLARRMIRWAGEQASAMITVCDALRNEMIRFGMDGRRITTLRNGIDLELFRPGDRTALRKTFGLDGFTLLSVGHLDPRKGHDHVIAALPALPGVRLLIAGSGPDLKKLQTLAVTLGVADRVTFLGAMPQDRLVLSTLTLIALPIIGAALATIPSVGAQLAAVCGNLQMAIAGALATTIAIRLYHMTMDGVTGLTGAGASGTPAAATR